METANPANTPAPTPSAKEKTSRIVSEYLKGKDEQWKALYERKGALTLLELPVDILRLIVKEITHTNDLTALALTNSALYNLAVPLIYSRFDIVWPDGHITSSESKSVDALTYGLSTLCLGSPFARTTRRVFHPNAPPLAKFIGNEYAKYTKKFSLGNGPNDWVAEYMITKESGKMLGTLVAIAVAKMKNLETFVWDMPTGVLSDIFMALASLGEQTDNDCKLNRVWIRWHDNSDSLVGLSSATTPGAVVGAPAVVPLGSQLTPIGILLPPNATHPPARGPIPYSEHHCEYPTFSVLPPLRSLTVLDVDELAYLDEMAVLIERSQNTLQELRVGISAKAAHKDFVQTWDGVGLKQIDHRARWPGENNICDRRLGGVLGVLVGKIYDIRKRGFTRGKEKLATDSVVEVLSSPTTPVSTGTQAELDHTTPTNSGAPSPQPAEAEHIEDVDALQQGDDVTEIRAPESLTKPSKASSSGRRLEGKLKLQTLELERVPLSMQVCRHAIDWSVLSSLTLLECAQHENLWKMLRKQFQPTPLGPGFGISSSSKPPASSSAPQYHLALKYIHTDITTSALITFIKETLAPNTLEVLFLQDRRRGSGPPPVTVDAIFKGAMKRHRASLQKLLIDSSAKPPGQNSTTPISDNIRWRVWSLNTEILLYITSGRMCNLRELAISLDYKDWHTFLQRLPNIPQLRSINIPHIADYVAGTFEPRELAHQIADIITLRPEIRMCYVGIGAKCFEILEARDTGSSSMTSGASSPVAAAEDGPASQPNGSSANGNGTMPVDQGNQGEDTSDEDDDEDEEAADADDSEDTDDDDHTPTTATSDPDETQSDNEAPADEDDSDDDGFIEPDRGCVKLRLREILFYDDKVAIFRARHGKL
ncbi:hypothetical protein B0H67DRAFT_562924 [Lasiosphaeris hirsuta]|uniref:F-box domain-containing protein n=1 Tax=Lasiosphaeris hirsuta TaxID=260670 RepID=A0AA40BAW2_9PEZI|nr:hypothetical protein B0H67DRAFT_562924 [Lasiosphaeris hirsuta]